MSGVSINRTRPRGDTASLSQAVQDNIEAIVECPLPEKLIKDYTIPRLQESLTSVRNYLKYRDMIPRLNVFVTLPEDLLKDTIQAPDDDELRAHTLRIV